MVAYVYHDTYGVGQVNWIEGKCMEIDFDGEARKFVFPDAFGKHLSTHDAVLLQRIEAARNQKELSMNRGNGRVSQNSETQKKEFVLATPTDIMKMEKEFKDWMSVQTSAQGNICTPSTVNHNYRALASVFSMMTLPEFPGIKTLFEICELNTFSRIKRMILSHRDFDEVNKACANGYLRTGLNWYEKFLSERKENINSVNAGHKSSSNEKGMETNASAIQNRNEADGWEMLSHNNVLVHGKNQESEFRKWMAEQDSAKGGKCSQSAINNNCNALNKVFSKMSLPGFSRQTSMFEIADLKTFGELKRTISHHPDYEYVNKTFGNGYLRTGLNWYEKYLRARCVHERLENKAEEVVEDSQVEDEKLKGYAKNQEERKTDLYHPITNERIELTKEQQGCVDYVGKARKDLVIRSVAGGGKSLVLIERAREFLKTARIQRRENAIAVFTYNHVLANYLKEWMQLSPEDAKYIYVGTLHEYLNSIYFELPGRKLGYQAYAKVIENACNETLCEYAKRSGSDKYKQWGIKFWNGEFTWMRSMNIFDRSDESTYLSLEREGRGHDHHMFDRDRHAAFEMFCLFQNKLRAKKVFFGEPTGDERILYLTHIVKNIPDDKRFDHVLIDEAQDQTLAKMIALKMLAKMDVTVCMDANQRIYEGRWKFSQWGNPASKCLPHPFRCTDAIDALAESLKAYNQSEMDDEEIVDHVASTAHGEKPEIIKCDNEDEEKRYVIHLVKKWMQEDPKHTIGIMCYKKDAVDKIGEWLGEEHIGFDYIRNDDDANYSIKAPGVKICTMHTSKGLEFMRVILPQFYQGMIPQRWAINDEEDMIKQRNVAYVGMTRAMHQLVIVYNGKKSQFVDEMDSDLYQALTYRDAVRELRKPTPSYQKHEMPKEEEKEMPKKTDRRSRWSF